MNTALAPRYVGEVATTDSSQKGEFWLGSRKPTDVIGSVVLGDNKDWKPSSLLGTSEQTDDELPEIKMPASTFLKSFAGVIGSPGSVEQLAEWSGYVTSIQEEGYSFSATLTGVSGIGVEGEQDDAIIPVSDVAEADKELLRVGNFFRLCVTQEVTKSGQPRRYTQVIFRRMPAYRREDLESALGKVCASSESRTR